MLKKYITTILPIIIKYKIQLRILILIVTSILLFTTKISNFEIFNDNYVLLRKDDNEVYVPEGDIFTKVGNNYIYNLDNDASSNTILIKGYPKDKEHFEKLIYSIEENRRKRNFRKFGNNDIKNDMPSKNILFVLSEYPKLNYNTFFAVIEINFGEKISHVEYRPFSNPSCNLDLFNATIDNFPPQRYFSLDFLITNYSNNPNTIHLNLDYTRPTLKTLIFYLNTIRYVDSHELNTYYYILCNNMLKHIRLEHLLPFIISTAIYEIFDIKETQETFYFLLYLIFPLTFIFSLKEKGSKAIYRILLFNIVNFKMGIIYTFIIFIRNCIRSIIDCYNIYKNYNIYNGKEEIIIVSDEDNDDDNNK
ncbi:hypothetical protein SLOPH_1747 [Spraguea lophii 42_110]|uniref:Uncharacterized protein n=1 Tax=Spraguea lophii (strain 42_110) TaxID=1358809 RepID=S7W7T6_SPRLO|nr:hypothetical protein SLOPH_1747 [Spraguea lophii 42_110]